MKGAMCLSGDTMRRRLTFMNTSAMFLCGSGESLYPGSWLRMVAGGGKKRLPRIMGMTSISSMGSTMSGWTTCVPRLITCTLSTP